MQKDIGVVFGKHALVDIQCHHRHCEEHSYATRQSRKKELDCFATLAMTHILEKVGWAERSEAQQNNVLLGFEDSAQPT